MKECGLAEFAHGHDPAGNPVESAVLFMRFRGQRFTVRQDVGNRMGILEIVAEQFNSGLGQGQCLFPALL